MQLKRAVSESGPKLRMASIMKPREPPELKGRSMATGSESVISLLTPTCEKTYDMPLLMISKRPLFRKNEIATNMPITYGKILTPVVSPHEKSGFFRFTSTKDAPLITTHFEIEDNVIPASNSVMANNLVVLSVYFNQSHYEKIAQKMLHHVLPSIDYPSAFSNWLNVFMHFSSQNKELAICGADASTNIKIINAHYLPNCIMASSSKPSNLPFLENRFLETKNLFYICQNKTCKLPTTNLQDALNELTII